MLYTKLAENKKYLYQKLKLGKGLIMREPWVAYVVVGVVVALMMLGKKMMFFSDDKKDQDD